MPAHRALEDLNLGFYQKTGYKLIGWGSGAPSNSTDIGYAHGAIYIRTGGTTGADGFYINTAASSVSSSTWQAISAANAAAAFDTITATTSIASDGTLSAAGAFTPTGGVAAAGGYSASPCGMIHSNGYPAIISTSGTELTPGATTTAYISEIFIPCNMTITGVGHFNGSDVTGNITVGMYTSAGVAISGALSAATAGSGTDAYQLIPFATPYAAKGPARYLVAFQYSSTSARPNCHLIGAVKCLAQTTFTVGTTAVNPLPTAFTATTCPMYYLY